MADQNPDDHKPSPIDLVYRSIGELSCAFSNNESVLMVLTEKLLITDRAGAILVFGTLNTTRARVDLLRRLARARLSSEPHLLTETEGLLSAFEKATRFRNDILHAMFVYGAEGQEIVETQAMRIDERRGTVAYGRVRPMDSERIAAILREVEKLNTWNRSMWMHIEAVDAFLGTNLPAPSMKGSEPSGIIGESNDLRP